MIRFLALIVAVAITAGLGLGELQRDAFTSPVKFCSIDPHYSFEIGKRRNLASAVSPTCQCQQFSY